VFVPVKKLLLQLDTSPLPSVFDRVVAHDGGADDVMSYGGVTPDTVRDLVHGCIFTRGPKDLKHTAIFVGGTEMAAGELLLTAVRKAFFGPMRVSVMLDSNGSNTTAVAAVAKVVQAAGGDVKGARAVVTAGTGPVGMRVAGLLAKAGADVTITSRRPVDAPFVEALQTRFGGSAARPVRAVTMADAAQASQVLERAELLVSAGPAGVCMVPKGAWAGRAGLRVAADLNAVPPMGIEGVDVQDNAAQRDGAIVFGALGVGGLKMKIHKACIARLFESNDAVLDAETIAEVAQGLVPKP
jgi:methylenetetrahydrofolate/methylenetetrahydromethanopterin dehydrogenase (NADP+)